MSRIVIADPQPFVRAALRQRLNAAGHEVIGEAMDGRHAHELVRRLHPDLLLLDLDLPRLSGLELLQRLHHEVPRQKSLVFTQLAGAHYQSLALRAGARGFVHKSDRPEELDEAVRLVLGGRQVFPARLPDGLGGAPGSDSLGEHITPRELTVLQYLAQGYRVKDIAEALAISDRTVSTYKTRLLEKTQTDSLIDLVDAAKVRGLLSDGVIGHLSHASTPPPSSTDELRQLLEVLPNPVSLWSTAGTLLSCNQSFAEVYQKRPDELLGARVFELGKVEPAQIPQAQQEFLKGAAGGKTFSLIVGMRALGESRTVRLIGVPLKEESGEVIGVLASYVDITENERYVERLQESKAYLESLYASRTEFLLSSGQDLLAETDSLGHLLAQAQTRHPEDDALAAAHPHLATLRDKLEILQELIQLERGTVLAIPQSEELNRLTEQALRITHPQLRFEANPEDVWGWIDPNRYQRLISVLLRCFDKAGIHPLELTASGAPLLHGEVEWRLTFHAPAAGDIRAQLSGLGSQARIHLAHRLCRLLGGELEVGSPTRAQVAALIQLKLPKGSPRF
ncbi:response regulator [Pseudomonas sp. PDM18]|uniref:response regulator n=1 Tax=unclassified Pseudomonas TaxID=196821 RepID=UPI0017805265|nr:response regulator [Pseudomonas sp. PDM18]MBD9676074.1 response regulator [Pseudomonas sp. PDM18]